MNASIAEDLYTRLLVINQEAFDAGLFDTAYHALASALHCAEHLPSNEPLLNVSQLAQEQLAWIDKHYPEYHFSTRSTRTRRIGKSVFDHLSSQAKMIVKMRHTNKQGEQNLDSQ